MSFAQQLTVTGPRTSSAFPPSSLSQPTQQHANHIPLLHLRVTCQAPPASTRTQRFKPSKTQPTKLPSNFVLSTPTLHSGAAMADLLMTYSRMLNMMPHGRSRDMVAAGSTVFEQVTEGLQELVERDLVKGSEGERLLFEVQRDLARMHWDLAHAPDALPVQSVRLQCVQAARILREL